MRLIAFAAWVGLWLLTPAGSQAQPSIPPACQGRDLLADLQTADPKAYAAIRAAADATVNARALLWRVEGQGRPPSFLFGTVHSTDARVHKLSPAITAAFEKADKVALELAELASDNAAAAMMKAKDIGKLMVYHGGGKGLLAHLSEDELKTLKARLASSGIPDDFVPMFRPWFAWAALVLPECEAARAAAGAPVLDQRIGKDALKAGKAVIGLETVDQQVGALAGLPESTQVYLLRTSIAVLDTHVDQWEVLHRLYLGRDVGAVLPFTMHLVEQAGFESAPFARFERDLIEKRNVVMRDAAMPLLRQGNAFIAVGALHLPGKAGLVELLRAQGFTVTAAE